MSNIRKLIFAVIVFSFIAAGFFYQMMPEMMASHWDASGQVNGYMQKFWALFLMPMITLVIYSLLLFLPKIDPLKANYAKFGEYYDGFLVAFVVFMEYVYALTIFFNKGIQFNMTVALIPAMAVLFWTIGLILDKTRQNWFIGIRTPWTMSSEKVWDKTNKLGAKLFKIIAVLSLAAMFFGDNGLAVFIISIMVAAFYLVIYSYIIYKKDMKS